METYISEKHNKKVMLWKLKKQNFTLKSEDEKNLMNISLDSLNN